MKKFELTTDSIKRNRVTLYRIKALIDFGDVKAGDLGGYVEKEENLSQYGNAWVSDNACVSGDALMYGDAWLSDNAWVYGNAEVFGNALVRGGALVYGNACVSGDALVYINARVYDNAWVHGNSEVSGNALVRGDARVYDNAWVHGNAEVSGNALVCGDAWVSDNACVSGDALVYGDADYIYLKGFGSHNRSTTMFRAKGVNICVSCGCFSGTLEEFESKVKETHGSNKFAREYLALVEAAKIHFEV